MLRTRRPSAVTLSPSPKPTPRGRLPGELPVYSAYLERVSSDESETSSSSSSSSSEDVGEQAFNCRIQESFPLCRKNPHKEVAERRKAFLVRSLLILFAFCIVFANWNYLFPAKRQKNSNPIVVPRDVPTGRKLTTETENARSLDTMANQSQIRRESEMKVLQKFGEGPYLVEFELLVWGDDNRPAKYFFTMELAPTYLMPTAVYYFLEQVDLKLWQDTSIYLNTGHIIVTQLVSGNRLISRKEKFESSGYGALPFREYSDGYPHLQYTVGLVGQGPAFFINQQYNFHHQDPCFGNIVIGRSTVDMISAMHGIDAETKSHIRPIDIVTARRIRLQDLSESGLAQYAMNTRRRQSQAPSL